MRRFKVQLLQDNIYQVFGWDDAAYISSGFTGFPQGSYDYNTVLFQGTLPECDAWIRLTEDGYL